MPLTFAPIDAPDGAGKYLETWQPPKREAWSIPPVIVTENIGADNTSIRLRQGIVCEVKIDKEWLFQNVNLNEDDHIDFSLHGDPEGIWGKLNTHSLLKVDSNIYFLNRTNIDVLFLAAF